MIKKTGILLILLSTLSCTLLKPIPQPKNEFRGVWVATVVNIDWPKSGTDEIAKQQQDFLNILDFYEQLNFNAVIVQIRTAGDSFYDSSYAPWSRFLTGKEGNPPKGEFDMLTWMIDESHARGFEYHAWLNPYRATFDLKTELLGATHDFNLHPEWMLKYGKKYYYDPGLPEVRKKLVKIMAEVVKHYDVDGIHFDDYFYPYKIKDEIFQDANSYAYYALPNQTLEDWRRSNVDSLIMNIHSTIKQEKPWVQFGVSPFGVWKNSATDPMGSDTKAGQTTYEDLYADPLTWMKKGWVDYLVPQVYWSMDLPVASHSKIVKWWSNHSTNTNLYIGNGAYKIRNNSDKAWDRKKELPDQIRLSRTTTEVGGNVLFSAKSLMDKHQDVVKYLKRKYYKNKVLSPISPLTGNHEKPSIGVTTVNRKKDSATITINSNTDIRYALVYTSGKKKKANYPIHKLLTKVPVRNHQITLNNDQLRKKRQLALTVINRYGQESDPILIHLNQNNDKKE